MLDSILIACAILGALALVFGVILTIANKVFAVYKDPKIDLIRDVLPGANCGGCGRPGCDAVAEAIAKGEAPINACPVGGAEVAAKVGEIMGIEATNEAPKVAYVRCSGGKEVSKEKYNYYGLKDCKAAATVLK